MSCPSSAAEILPSHGFWPLCGAQGSAISKTPTDAAEPVGAVAHDADAPIVPVGAVLGISQRTVMREWNLARAWLRRELRHSGKESG